MLSTLYRNHRALRTAFALLDVDGDGTLTRAEFDAGVAAANARLAPAQRVDGGALWRFLDHDANGEVR